MKLLVKLVATLLVLLIIAITFVWTNYTSLEPEVSLEERQAPALTDRPINIGVIGESWAAGKKIDNFLIEALAKKAIDSTVVSSGHPGAKSKFVYQNLFKSLDTPHSSNEILTGETLDYCIVLTGVNDTATYVGADYYAHHIDLIVKALLKRGITPVIVEIPEYGIEVTDSKTLQGKIRRRMMRFVHDNNEVDVIPKYRDAAKEKLSAYIENKEIIYFPFSAVTSDYEKDKDLYKENFLYLNKRGNKKLGYALAETIADWTKSIN